MQHRITHWLAIGSVAALAACASRPPVTTSSPTTSTVSTGDVALGDDGGAWADSNGGTWMDNSGGMYAGGRGGRGIGLQAADVRAMNNPNIVAHLAAGDSLEIALSQLGVSRAQNSAVRDFAQRMVTEHSAHMQMGQQMAMQGGITPQSSPADTTDAMMATRIMNRLSGSSSSDSFDQQFMRAELMMHQHMLHELTLVRPQASGAVSQLVDQTIPVVQQHLSQARSIWRQVGGSSNGRWGNGTNGGTSGSTNGSTSGTSGGSTTP